MTSISNKNAPHQWQLFSRVRSMNKRSTINPSFYVMFYLCSGQWCGSVWIIIPLYGYVSRIQIQDPNPGSESGSKEKMYNFNFLPSHVSAHLPYTVFLESGFVYLHTDPHHWFRRRNSIFLAGRCLKREGSPQHRSPTPSPQICIRILPYHIF